ncbi:hypothetical protein, partial [Chitinolyticbacter albus]|uniref:hypothetical protein n=1 Tax=Chitinolyticbacter albus TaxID=2961951 RepID=UPI00210E1AF3
MAFRRSFFLLVSIALACSHAALAQEEIRFGAPIKAGSAPRLGNLLSLSSAQPPRELARGADIVLVSGYEPSNSPAGMAARVHIDRPGPKVLLVLSSYEKINWQVTASAGTAISGILVSGYYPPTVAVASRTIILALVVG